ncbi:MAG: flavin reductase family protein [bacterium]|nr:flavin reductase family protein [bacterium]
MSAGFQSIDPKKLEDNVIKLIGKDWMLITAGDIGSYNTMTASWGTIGHLWEKEVTFCFIRPQRHTFGFVEKNDYYSFSFFEEKYREALNICGTVSGKDVDKAEKCNITPVSGPNNTVYFEEARVVIVNKKIYTQSCERDLFLDPQIVPEFYPPDMDIHKMFIGEITDCLIRS